VGPSVLRSTSAHVFVEPDVLDADLIALDDASEHHLRRVVRLRDGETVGVTDGEGRWRLATVRSAGSTLTLESTTDVVVEERPEPITIAVAIPKGDRLDWLVQKTTEIGVDRIQLLHAERSVVRWRPEKVATQLARLERIAGEACRQSRRVWRAEIVAPVDAVAVLADFVVAEPGGRSLAPGDRAVAVGPEGGWTDTELALAAETATLGVNVLRTETAAVAASTLCVAFNR
jgi:16S rRNA (uracil1498-N3)-methyltransferase